MNLVIFPKKKLIDSNSEMKEYIPERISNLNSYYYVRVDNGILAPFLALLVIRFMLGNTINIYWTNFAIFIGLVLTAYIIRIQKEIKEYIQILEQ